MRSIFFLFIFICNLAYGQESPYKFSKDIFDKYYKDTTLFKNQTTPWDFSYIGDYKNCLAVWDSGRFKTPDISIADSLYFFSFHPVNAKEYILNRAKSEQIIIINEAHQQPMHRVFTTSLLPELFKLGFNYFCAESLDKADTLLNERKYPVMLSGYYLREPQYGNLTRTALQIGYNVNAYDYGDAASGKEREIGAAKKIKAILDKEPAAKIIIHCGFDHIREDENIGSWEKAMAGRVKEYTGINPFTIDQVKLTETSNPIYDNPFFKIANLDYHAIFIDTSGKLFNGQKGFDQYDVRVYHPRTKWKYGRPNWIFENGKQPCFVNSKILVSFPCLVLAYFANEDTTTAIPTDVIELKNKDDNTALALPKGQFIIIIKDTKGKEQTLSIKQ
jgi:hypothetical protein